MPFGQACNLLHQNYYYPFQNLSKKPTSFILWEVHCTHLWVADKILMEETLQIL